jgi:hypothetical protein
VLLGTLFLEVTFISGKMGAIDALDSAESIVPFFASVFDHVAILESKLCFANWWTPSLANGKTFRLTKVLDFLMGIELKSFSVSFLLFNLISAGAFGGDALLVFCDRLTNSCRDFDQNTNFEKEGSVSCSLFVETVRREE